MRAKVDGHRRAVLIGQDLHQLRAGELNRSDLRLRQGGPIFEAWRDGFMPKAPTGFALAIEYHPEEDGR
jgi:hypothetical protein